MKGIEQRIKLTVFLGFFIAISIFSVLCFYVYRNNLNQLESAKLVSHSNEVLLATEHLLDNLFEAETSQRGFIITGEEIFLEPYRDAIDSMNYHIENLRALTLDNPLQQQHISELEPLIERRLQFLAENLELRKNAGFEITREQILSLRGKKLMGTIKEIINKMHQMEKKLLIERKRQTELQTVTFNTTYFSAIAIVGIIMSGLFIIIYKNLQARDKSEKALTQHKIELEQTVQQRTAELTKLNQTLIRNSELLNDMGKLSKVGGWEIDMADMSVQWTDEVYRIHELEPGKKPSVEEGISYYAPEARPVIQEAVSLAITSGQGWDLELPFITAKGNHLWVRAIGNAVLKDGKAARVYGTFQDITEQKKTRDQIIDLNEKLEQKVAERTEELEVANKDLSRISSRLSVATNAGSIGIWDWDIVNNKLEWDKQMFALYGITENQFGGAYESWQRGLHPEDVEHCNSAIHDALQGNREFDTEFRVVWPDSSIHHIKGKAVVLKDSNGNPVQMIGTNWDFTESKDRESEITNLNKELESFSYSISHDLRAPLRSINGYANALLEDYADKLDEEGRRLLDVVVRSAKRMGQLIDDLLAFSKLGRQPLSKIELNMDDFVKQTADELVAEENGRSIALEIKPLGKSVADVNMLRQVWINLLSNALKYSQKKEKSVIEVGSLNDKNGMKTFYVRDNGAGFDMAYSNKLFGVFQRLHKVSEFEGTGVGLALTKRIIDKHGGQIWAEAELGKGATFYFNLPEV